MSNGQVAPETQGVAVELRATVDLGPEIEDGHGGERTSTWFYMSATLSPWGNELAQGDGPAG